MLCTMKTKYILKKDNTVVDLSEEIAVRFFELSQYYSGPHPISHLMLCKTLEVPHQ